MINLKLTQAKQNLYPGLSWNEY